MNAPLVNPPAPQRTNLDFPYRRGYDCCKSLGYKVALESCRYQTAEWRYAYELGCRDCWNDNKF